MSWSTGKDSAFALHELKKKAEFEVIGLFTTITEDYSRVSMHATREDLLRRQADTLGLQLESVYIPANCSNELYEARMQGLIDKALKSGIHAFGFGDLYLEDIRRYRERMLSGTAIEPIFPLWNRPTDILAQEILTSGIEAVITCVDPTKLPSSFAGRLFNQELLKEFPVGVDPCGENGEFHTFVFNSPDFKEKISIHTGETVSRGGFVFSDVIPVHLV